MVLREKISDILGIEISHSDMLYIVDYWSAWALDADSGYPSNRKFSNVDSIIKDIIVNKHTGDIENGF